MRVLTPFAPSDVATPEPPQLRSRRREDVPDRFKWSLSDIFPDWTAWEAGYKQLETGIERYAELKGTLAGGSDALLTAFRLSEEERQFLLGAAYPVSERFEIYGRIENLFDARYETVLDYNTPGRAAYAGVRVRL